MKNFLWTYRSFTTPDVLLTYASCCLCIPAHCCRKLIQRFDVPNHVSPEEKEKIQTRLLVTMRHWISIEVHDLGTVLDKISAFLEEAKIATHSTKICSIVEGLKKSIINLVRKFASRLFTSFSKRKIPPIIFWRSHPSPRSRNPSAGRRDCTCSTWMSLRWHGSLPYR